MPDLSAMFLCLMLILLCGVSKDTLAIENKATTNTKESSTNFLILFADDLGYGDLSGSFGHPTSNTPNLLKLGKDSKVFTNFYVASPVCSPSRAALLTGKYPVQVGIYPRVLVPDDKGGLSLEHETIAKKLYAKGYATAHVGKWHLGVGVNREWLPTRHGFQTYHGIPYSHDMCPCIICFPDNGHCHTNCRNDDVSCPLIETKMSSNDSIEINGDDSFKIIQQPADLPNLTNLYTQKSIEFMEESAEAQQPFLLYVAYHQTHTPQFSGSSFFGSTDRGAFGDALAEMDDSIGKILNYLDEAGLRENTMIFFTSDNGPLIHEDHGDFSGCAGPLRCGKGTTWEGGQRVPGMISQANKIEPGVSHALASSLDILPTIMSIVGDPVPDDSVGYDFSDYLFNGGEDPRNGFLYYPKDPKENEGPYAVRYKSYKAHFYTRGSDRSGGDNYDKACQGGTGQEKHDPPLLFDLNVDPGERFPISNTTEAYEKILQELMEFKTIEVSKIGEWAPSALHGKTREAEICCNPIGTSCEPFPSCCDCPS